MANALATLFTDIADSIRSKTGSSDKMSPSEFPSQIDSISVGGGGIPTGYKTVTFKNGDNVLFERLVLNGDDCPDPLTQGRIETPTKESTPQYNYTYSGWTSYNGGTANSSVLKNITENKVVYSAYSATAVKYTITYYDEDGVTVLHTEQLGYGSVPNYMPTKDGFAFDKWTPTPVKVTGNASYTASWASVLASGTCGNKVTWSLNTDYVLIISGTGAMDNFSDGSPPWKDYLAQIKSIVITDGVTYIGNYAFKKLTALTSVIIPDSVASMGYGVFQTCTSLTSITIPDSVTSMGMSMFIGCSKLTQVTLGNSVSSIGNTMFQNCTSLTSITIPKSVTNIGPQAFDGCKSMASIEVDSDNLYYCSVGGVLFDIAKTILVAYPVGKNLSSYTVPSGVTTIKQSAFRYSQYLSSIVIPDGVITLESTVFANCTSLTSITIPKSVTSIGGMSFMHCSNLAEATFEDTEGWKAGNTVLSSANLANPTTAAQYLNNKYQYNTWTKS